ncbi:hypothetical protein AYO40_01160 [Planctomycetaceae bacterium SCGC AG-212-D15]|nr:hypothetical protein AYO40_01160 [Planctomycetaceae bacterium SCGC AG-212-D15]
MWGGGSKEFTDVLGPLVGLVRKNIGRPFDKFYSEVKQKLPGKTLATQHILGHLWQILIKPKQVQIIDGKPFHKTSYRWDRTVRPIEAGSSNFDIAYVDPRDGIIKAAPKRKRERRQRNKPSVRNIDGSYYTQINDVWYLIAVEPVTPQKEPWVRTYTIGDREYTHRGMSEVKVFDCLLGKEVHPVALKSRYGEYVRAVGWRQINKRQIKKLGLRDD